MASHPASRPSARFSGGQAANARSQNLVESQRRASLAKDTANEEEAAKAKKKRSTLIFIIVGAIVGLIIIGALVYYFLLRKKPATTTSGGTGSSSSSSSSSSGSGGGGGVALGGACTSSSQCSTALAICSKNICKNPPGSTCTDASTCPDLYECDATHVCKGDIGGICSTDNNCESPLTCITNKCAKKTCTVQANCTNGGVCNQANNPSTNCLGLLGGVCQMDTDCVFPYRCTGGKCAEQLNCVGGDCRGLPSTCHAGTPTKCILAPQTPCDENAQCDSPGSPGNFYRSVCDNDPALNPGTLTKKCKAYGAEMCNTAVANDCLSNTCTTAPCHVSADCVSPTCGCLTDAQCAPGQKLKYCNPNPPQHICVECRTNADCTDPTNPICDILFGTGRCTHSCTVDAQCTDTALPSCVPGLNYCSI